MAILSAGYFAKKIDQNMVKTILSICFTNFELLQKEFNEISKLT